jgi:hypothetical protein
MAQAMTEVVLCQFRAEVALLASGNDMQMDLLSEHVRLGAMALHLWAPVVRREISWRSQRWNTGLNAAATACKTEVT